MRLPTRRYVERQARAMRGVQSFLASRGIELPRAAILADPRSARRRLALATSLRRDRSAAWGRLRTALRILRRFREATSHAARMRVLRPGRLVLHRNCPPRGSQIAGRHRGTCSGAQIDGVLAERQSISVASPHRIVPLRPRVCARRRVGSRGLASMTRWAGVAAGRAGRFGFGWVVARVRQAELSRATGPTSSSPPL